VVDISTSASTLRPQRMAAPSARGNSDQHHAFVPFAQRLYLHLDGIDPALVGPGMLHRRGRIERVAVHSHRVHRITAAAQGRLHGQELVRCAA
jgi:cellobiose-specific phosphotransferase system component IIB